MIARLKGIVVDSDGGSVVLDVAGVGYRVSVPGDLAASVTLEGDPIVLHIETVMREDGWQLFGFSTPEARRLFQMLIGVTGVGPRLALAMLTTYSPHELPAHIAQNDARALAQTPGVGPRLAQRICLELGEKMAELAFTHTVQTAAAGPEARRHLADLEEALVALGYSRADSHRAAERAVAAQPQAGMDSLLRGALNLLTGGR